jgi:hypothetical protein
LPAPIDTAIPGGKVGRRQNYKTSSNYWGGFLGGYNKIDDMDYSASCFSDLNSQNFNYQFIK